MLAVLGGLVVAASAPALAAGYWLAAGIRGPVTAAGPQILPPFVAAASAGPDQARTLVLRQDGAALSYAVLRSTDPVLGEPELTGDSSAASELDGVVASLAAAAGGDGGDAGQALRQFDIGYILLPAPVDQALASQLAGAAGLIRLTSAPAYDLWQVAGTVARASVMHPTAPRYRSRPVPVGVNTVLTASTSGTLVLAEAAGGWSATLNGKPLTPLARPVDGWAQGFALPAGGGRLVITRDETARDLSLGAEAVAVLVVFALALPGYQVRRGRPQAAAGAGDRRRAGGQAGGAEPESREPPAAAGRRRWDRAAGPRPCAPAEPGRPDSPSPARSCSRIRAAWCTPALPVPVPCDLHLRLANPSAPRGQHAARHGNGPAARGAGGGRPWKTSISSRRGSIAGRPAQPAATTRWPRAPRGNPVTGHETGPADGRRGGAAGAGRHRRRRPAGRARVAGSGPRRRGTAAGGRDLCRPGLPARPGRRPGHGRLHRGAPPAGPAQAGPGQTGPGRPSSRRCHRRMRRCGPPPRSARPSPACSAR